MEYDDLPTTERPPRDGSWGLMIVTMLFVAYGVWSWYQISDLQKLRIEVSELRSKVVGHQVELSKLNVRLTNQDDQHPTE